MIKIENVEVYGFEAAIRAARNPLSSWSKSDSGYVASGKRYENVEYKIGENDLALLKRLVKAGVEHRTFCRLIQVSMDITAPLYWWKEMDRYCVGKSQIGTSTMHCIHKKEFTLDDFSHEHIGEGMATNVFNECLETVIDALNEARKCYLDTGEKTWWYQMIQLLPSSFNQKRTVLMSYEVVLKIIRERENHKLDEWRHMVSELKKLPYMEEILS